MDAKEIETINAGVLALLQQNDDVYRRDPVLWVRSNDEEVWSKQAEILHSVRDNRYTAVPSAHDMGKALDVRTPLPTPDGWTTMGGVRAGDWLLDENGEPIRVSWVSGDQYGDQYRVRFDDGTHLDANAEHQWSVRRIGRNKAYTTMTTGQMVAEGVLNPGGQRRFRVPLAAAVKGATSNLPVDPYVLGAWLGDGTSARAEITCHPDDFIVDEIARRGYAVRKLAGSCAWSLAHNDLLPALRRLGVLGHKHIPAAYLRAGYDQRLDLLRGIMDTDGYPGDSVQIDLASEQLARAVVELARSLGFPTRMRARPMTLNGRCVGTRYRITFRARDNPFLLPRKAEKWHAPAEARGDGKTIVSIEPITPVRMRCVAVDSTTHLYLAGEGFTVTHNSFIASRAIAWWISTHPPGSAMVVSTAPSAAQVSLIMWREVTKIHRKADLIGKITRAGYPQWIIDGEPVGVGRKPSDYQDSAFQGIHAQYILIVIDEACGVSQNIYDAVDSLATNENARVLAIGNPDDPASHFAKICEPGSGWNIVHLDALRSPNMTRERVIGDDPDSPRWPLLAALMEAEKIPYSTEVLPPDIRPMLVNEQWVEERIERWAGISRQQAEHTEHAMGRDQLLARLRDATSASAIFTAKVRGIFPTSAAESAVIPLGWVQRAMERWRDEKTKHAPGDFVLGVDVARSGDDQTVFAHRYGSFVKRIERLHVEDTMEIADRAASYLHEPRSTVVVDVIGIGAGVYDALRRYRNSKDPKDHIEAAPLPFNAAARTQGRMDQIGQFKFLNDRAAAWWNLRELLDPSKGSNIALPDDERLLEELIAPKFDFNVGGTLKIESKDDIKKRIGRSTDAADAVIAAFWAGGGMQYDDAILYSQVKGDQGVIRYEGWDNTWTDTLGDINLDFSNL